MNLDPDPDLALFFNGTGTPGILLALKYGGEFVSEKGKILDPDPANGGVPGNEILQKLQNKKNLHI